MLGLGWLYNTKKAIEDQLIGGYKMKDRPYSRQVIPPSIVDDPWPSESELRDKNQKKFVTDMEKLGKDMGLKDSVNEEPQELGDPLDVIAGDGVKLTFGEMVTMATELGLSKGGEKLPEPLVLATIMHDWFVKRTKKHQFTDNDADDLPLEGDSSNKN